MSVLLCLLCSAVLSADGAESVITNNFDPANQGESLPVESVFLYEPATEWTYSHHPSLAFFKGRYYAMWSNGRKDEDAPGQRVLYASSPDFKQWTTPKPLMDSVQGRHSEVALTAAGFYVHGDTMIAYAGQYEYKQEHLDGGDRKEGDSGHQDTGLWCMTTQDGEHWSAMQELHLPIVPNHPPQRTKSGRLIISGNISFPYTDNPDGVNGWKMTGIYPDSTAATIYDDSESFHQVSEVAGWPVSPCEGSFYQTDDGVLYMLLRSGTPHLWVTESKDDGTHWSTPRETEFTDNRAKFHCGRLPDGRFYHIGNPDPQGKRNPLVLSVSTDGIRFDRHWILAGKVYEKKVPGRAKGGVYGYPHSLIKDGYLCVIVSVCKESVLVLRVPLEVIHK